MSRIFFFAKATKRSSAMKNIDPFSDSDTETDVNKARITNRIKNNKKSEDYVKNDYFFGKATKGSSAIKNIDPFSDSDTETDVESSCEFNENKKDKKQKDITNYFARKGNEASKKYFPRKANKASKHACKQPKRMASKKFQKLSNEQKKEERRSRVYFLFNYVRAFN